jgi:small subunit ribosomal protein S20
MPNHKSAEKRDRQIKRRNEVNGRNRSRLRTAIKRFRAALSSGKPEEIQTLLPSVLSLIDRSIQKGIIHRNAAARYKSRLTLRTNKKLQPAA